MVCAVLVLGLLPSLWRENGRCFGLLKWHNHMDNSTCVWHSVCLTLSPSTEIHGSRNTSMQLAAEKLALDRKVKQLEMQVTKASKEVDKKEQAALKKLEVAQEVWSKLLALCMSTDIPCARAISKKSSCHAGPLLCYTRVSDHLVMFAWTCIQ